MKAPHLLAALSLTAALGCATVTTVDDPPPPNDCDERCAELWSFEYGDGPPNHGYAIGSDAQGNVVFAAQGSGDVDLGGGVIDARFLLAKLDPAGVVQWVNGYPKGLTNVAGMAVSEGGRIAVAGTCREAVIDLGGGPLVESFNDHEETCMAVIDEGGAHVWSARFGTTDPSSYIDPSAIAITPSGDVIVALAFTGTVDLDGVTLTGPDGDFNYETLIARFDPQGHLRWARHIQNGVVEQGASLPIVSALAVTPSGDVALGGVFYGSIVVDAALWSSHGEGDAFIALLGGDTGEMRWGSVVGGGGADGFVSLAPLADGGVLAAGWYEGAVDVEGQALPDGGYQSSLLLAFGAEGEIRFARSLGDALPEQFVRSAAPRPDGDLVVIAPLDNAMDGFEVVRFDALAEHEVRRQSFVASSESGPHELLVNSFALDPLGNALFTGSLRGTVDFGTGALHAGPSEMPWAEAIFVAKVDP